MSYNKTIEITKINTTGNVIQYEIQDNTSLNLLKNQTVEAWVEYHHAESFDFSLNGLPESILAIPATLYLLPVTWFYGVELVVPSMDKMLSDHLSNIYSAYSKIYGPFKKEWCGKVTAKDIVENHLPNSRFDNIVFFSGGVDAVHAGINHTGSRNVLVSVPSIEFVTHIQKTNARANFYDSKTKLISDFSAISGSNWLLITNNFRADIFNDSRIQSDLKNILYLSSEAFLFDGWYGIKYLGNLLSAIPFAYAMGIKNLIMGSGYEQLEDMPVVNQDGANPDLSNSFKIAGIIFAEQDGLCIRRSLKVKNIIDWGHVHNKGLKLWTCFNDQSEQCGVCTKCVRTQLNILCMGENPAAWGFRNFSEKNFSRLIRSFKYYEKNTYMLWDIIDSIDENTVYPYCNDLLHWMKRMGYKKYYKKVFYRFNKPRFLRFYKYPHYMKKLFQKVIGR